MPASEKREGNNRQILRASEMGEYVFCHRAWWLHRVKGIESANQLQMQAGVSRHVVHGKRVQRAVVLQRLAVLLLVLAGILAAVWLFAVVTGP